MNLPGPVDHQPPPSLDELSSLEIRLAKGTLSDAEYRTWLPRMIAAYKELLPEQPSRDTAAFSTSRANG